MKQSCKGSTAKYLLYREWHGSWDTRPVWNELVFVLFLNSHLVFVSLYFPFLARESSEKKLSLARFVPFNLNLELFWAPRCAAIATGAKRPLSQAWKGQEVSGLRGHRPYFHPAHLA